MMWLLVTNEMGNILAKMELLFVEDGEPRVQGGVVVGLWWLSRMLILRK